MNWKKTLLLNLVAGILSAISIMAFDVDNIRFHINDLYMIIFMASWSILLVSLFGDSRNYSVATICILSIIVTIYLIVTQTFVTNLQFIRGMIPHDSAEISMAQGISNKTQDDNIKKLAQNIISDRQAEIVRMKQIEMNIS